MDISVNGQKFSISLDQTLSDLLHSLQVTERHLAVAVNSEIVPRSQLAERHLQPGDEVELLQAVGGG